jgi:outer membrane protein TolC
VLTISLSTIIQAQTELTINDAINLAHKNNLELNKNNLEIKRAEVDVSSAKRLPNPSLNFSREDLSDNNQEIDEWSLVGSLPINFLWERWSNIESQINRMEAQKLVFEYKKHLLNIDVQKTYTSLHLYSLLCDSLKLIELKLNKLVEIAQNRFKKEDISAYELHRIQIEFNKVKSSVTEYEKQRVEIENKLKQLTGIRSEERITTHVEKLNIKFPLNEKDLVTIALNNRFDLKAIKTMINSEKYNLDYNKVKLIPEIRLSGGYKKQSDLFEGSLVEIELKLPLFDRNQEEISNSELAINSLEKELLYLIENIKLEVMKSHSHLLLNKRILENVKINKYKNFFNAASLSYEFGETSLVEFIDGLNAHLDEITLHNQIELNYLNSVFDLEKSIGTKLINVAKN